MLSFIEIISENYDNCFKPAALRPVSSGVVSAPNAHIEENVFIGENSEIFPFAVIHSGSVIGEKCRIQANSVIGAVGMAYAEVGMEYSARFTHLGAVRIGDNVDIGANSIIVRGILQDTVIGNGTKIGNGVNIGHNTIIGKNCFISSNVTLCGSVVLEDGCWIAPGTTVLNKVVIRENTQIGVGSVVRKSTDPDSVYVGNPAKRIGRRRR